MRRVFSSVRSKEDHGSRRIVLYFSEWNDMHALGAIGINYKKCLWEPVYLVSLLAHHTIQLPIHINRNMKTSTLFLGVLAAFQYALAASVDDKCTVGYCTLNGG